MTKRRNSRYTKRSRSIDPYANLVSDIITNALLVASGQTTASEKEVAEAVCWLRSETCQRWALTIGVDLRVALEHKDSLVKLDE
jgi:hypothetical protein